MTEQELREKIAKREAEGYPYFKVWDYLDSADKVPYLEDADRTLALIKEAGYVKLADDQSFSCWLAQSHKEKCPNRPDWRKVEREVK